MTAEEFRRELVRQCHEQVESLCAVVEEIAGKQPDPGQFREIFGTACFNAMSTNTIVMPQWLRSMFPG